MLQRNQLKVRAGGIRIGMQLLGFALLLLMAFPAFALNCSDFPGGVIDGDVEPSAPSQVQIDQDCTFTNWPAGNELNTNISFKTQPGQTQERWLVIFDNVVHTGQMSCNKVAGHVIWFVNGSSSSIQNGNCQNLLIPVEKIDKQNPAGQTTAAIGVPFTYTLTIPVLFDPGTGTVITSSGSDNALHSIVLTDDLNATGVDLTFLGFNAYWKSTNVPVSGVNFSNVGGLLTFDFGGVIIPGGPLPAGGEQIVIEITLVLDDTPTNAPGTQFINVAEWEFGRFIDGVFHAPLPGENGITEPLTIAAPNLVMTKTGPATLGLTLNLGQWGNFALDVQNTGLTDAWNATIRDQFPDGATGGMCDTTPEVLNAQIFAADGTTPVSPVLVEGTDYSLVYAGAPTCELTFTMLTAAGAIGPSERLIITYRTKLDPDTQDGATLTNVAGATEWFNDNPSNSNRVTFTRTLTNGTPTVVDHEDEHTVVSALFGYFFEKSVANLDSGANPATTAVPGDTLLYTLRLQATDVALNDLTFRDDLGALNNPLTVFDPGSLQVVSLPPFAIDNSDPLGGTNQAGLLDISNLSVPANSEIQIQFEIRVDPGVPDGTVILNQADLIDSAGNKIADSDDPNINGQADPSVPGDEDPTRILVSATPPPPLKEALQSTATIGEQFTYRITVPETPYAGNLYDVRIQDNLAASGADLRFVSLTKVSGPGTPENIGTATNLIIAEDATNGIDIPAGQQLVIDVTVELLNTSTNVRPLSFTNSAAFTFNRVNNDNATSQSGGASGPVNMTVVEPVVTMTKAVSNVTPGKAAGDPAAGGDILEYALTIINSGDSIAHDVNVTDILPPELTLVASSATAQINGSNVIGFNPTPTTVAPNTLIWGRANGDDTLDIPIGGDLVLTYRVTVQDIAAASISNNAWVDWTSLDGSYPVVPAPGRERTGEGCGIGTITPPNSYCYGPETATIATLDTNAIAKAVTNDTWDTGLSTNDDAIARVGDTITYQLTLTLREGQTRNVSIQDALDPGLAFVDVVSINGDTTAPYSSAGVFTYADIPAGNLPTAGQTGTLTWTLGDIVNAVDNDPSNNDLVIVYRTRVLHGAAEPPPPTPTTTTLNNQATLGYTFADGITPVPLDPTRMQDGASIEVRQPAITTITKTGTVLGPPAAGTGTQADPYVVDITNNSMDFSLEACNTTGQAPAYGVVITDQLAPELEETTVSTPVVTINGAPATAGVDYTYTPPAGPGGTLSFQLLTEVNPNQCVTVSYTVGFDPLVPPNQLWSNSATVGEYWSLPPSDAREYIAITPVTAAMVWMTNNANLAPPTKVLSSPASGEVTIGEQVVYEITVPGAPVNAALSDVVVTDTLHPSLEYVSATAVFLGGAAVALTDNTTGNNVNLGITQIPANEQVVITLTARVTNNADANAGVSFTNTASYTFVDGGGATLAGGSGTSTALTIVEPLLAINKGVANVTNPGNPPTAGDVLRYTLTFPASAGTNFSDAFDLGIVDNLSLGLAYQVGTATVSGAGNTIADPAITGDGVTIPQTLTWDLATADIDVPEGATVTVTYDVLVLDGVLANQNLVNGATVQWTSLDGASTDERNGVGCPTITPPNDYCAGPVTTTVTTPDNTTLTKTFVSDTSPLADPNVRVGDLVEYELRIGLQEGQHQNLVLTDTLPQGLAFVGTVSINGDTTAPYSAAPPFTHANIAAPSVGGDPVTGPTAVAWTLGNVVNAADGDPTNDVFVIVYRAQVLNDVHPQVDSITLANNAQLTYTTGTGSAQQTAGTSITLLQPSLTVSKSAAPAGGDPVIDAGEVVTYTVDIVNSGTAPAYDTVLQDVIPVGLRNGAATITVVSISLLSGPVLPNLAPVYDPATGVATWNFDTGAADDYTIPAGDTLRLVYQVQADASLSAGMTLINQAQVQLYYSFDDEAVPSLAVVDDREVYGPTNTATTTLTTATPVLVFQKVAVNETTGQNPAVNASPGDVVRYDLTIVNTSGLPVSNFSLVDELDRLNTPPVFAPGSLQVVASPGTDNSNPLGGTNGTGLVDIRNLTLAASDGAPGGADELLVQYRVTLQPVITNGTVVLDQAQLLGAGPPAINSDDPNVNGADDPNVLGDEDPTRIVITSAPVFQVQKTSQDLTGDPTVLFAGDTLRYTITVKNIGTENAVNVVLRDQIPANTTYVANSTTLNGALVPDTGGTTALQSGILIHAPPPEDQTPGVMRADATSTTSNVATITFDVVVDPAVPDGTIISNQGFVSGQGVGGAPFPEQPSDDPDTPAVDDPTLDIVGNLPLLSAQKTVQLLPAGDLNSNGFVDPGERLTYTITIVNSGAIPATGVVLSDTVPANTTYVTGSVLLDGNPVAGVSPPVLQIPISTLSAGATAVVTFEVDVNIGVLPGTIISNQGSVASNELPTLLTNVAVIVVGDVPQLVISKEVFVVGGGAALAGGQLDYVVRITNIGTVPATNVVITDDLSPLGADPLVPGSATLNGLTNGISYAAPVLTADYSTPYGDLLPGATATLRFRANIAAGVPIGTTITNTALVTWDPSGSASDSVSIDIGGTPGSAILNGRVWHDANFNNAFDGSEQPLAGWAVELRRNGTPLATTSTASDGSYQFSGLAPNDITGDQYEIRFSAPGAGPNTAMLGQADSPFTNGLQVISAIIAGSGSNLQNLNLPIDPNGVIYDSVIRTPIAGATLRMLLASTGAPVDALCFDDPVQQGQVTLASGYYKFDLNFNHPSCPAGSDYVIEVTAPAAFGAFPSQIIPPGAGPFSVPACPADAILSTNHCEVQGSEFAPSTAVPPGSGTTYYLHVTLSNGTVPQDSQLFNNHIPIDPEFAGAIAITKTTPLFNVTRAGQVPYTITVENTLAGPLQDLAVVDRMPPGFKYVKGSGRINGVAVEPVPNGRQLTWGSLTLAPNEKQTIQLLLVVGSGVSEGEYVNSAQAFDSFGNGSNVATATVQVVPDPTFDCTDVIGKVFDDANLNGYQDKNETGLGGIRVVSARGLLAKTDEYGRFHITCAVIPNETRGSNFILKLDDRTLPTGYRLTTRNPLVRRATRGKAIKFNFGAALHRVVRLDVADGVFEPDSTDVRPQWKARFQLLLDELRKSPSILRISYLADVEDEGTVKARVRAIKREVAKRWEELNCCYRLTIETEIFWRRGGPPVRKTVGGK
jgi:uncharacterized repeat protein (TIGR01451 family)/fimbrial isopeptide formation D2 family protein